MMAGPPARWIAPSTPPAVEFRHDGRTAGTVDRAIHPTASGQRGICSIRHGVDGHARDVAFQQDQPAAVGQQKFASHRHHSIINSGDAPRVAWSSLCRVLDARIAGMTSRACNWPTLLFAVCVLVAGAEAKSLRFAVLVSADMEWKAVKPLFAAASVQKSPYGEYFYADVQHERVLFFQGGWGKVAAAGSTQYVIDHFQPARLLNLGTCGGVEGRIQRFDVIAPDKVVIYDIAEAMGDSEEAIAHYTTTIKLPERGPLPVVKATLYSADRDLTSQGLRDIENRFHPVAVDWESGAIAWVAQRNGTPLLILRGVSDLVSPHSAEAQGNPQLFEANAARVMQKLVGALPKWIAALN